MEIRTDARYNFSDRYKGEYQLELFNEHYLRVYTKRLKKAREFKMEVATLNPEAEKINHFPWKWLAASIVSFALVIYLIYFMFSAAEGNTLWYALGGAAAMLLLSAGFGFAFWIGREQKWVFYTIAAQYPLVVIPYNKETAKQAQLFAERLSQAIRINNDKKGYSPDDLSAGEMRMLRRLAKSGVISDDKYDSAKKQILGGGNQAAFASA
jgi:hypothetical protein